MVPTRPLPEQSFTVYVGANPRFLSGVSIVSAVSVILVVGSEATEQGVVFELTAAQRAAVFTESCKRLSLHRMKAVCISPKTKTMTGSITSANSTADAPRSHRNKVIMSEEP